MSRPAPLRLAFFGNAASVHVRRWLNFFASRGHAVTLLDLFGSDADPALDRRISVHHGVGDPAMRLPVVRMLHRRRAIRRLLDDFRPDVVHAHSAHRHAWQALLAGAHPLVVSVWGSDVLRPLGWRGRLWTRAALRSADLVTAVTPSMAAAARHRGARAGRTLLVHHGVDLERYRPGVVPDEELVRLGVHPPYILSPRTLRPIYNHETVVRAVAELETPHELVMTDVGADPAYRAGIVDLAERLGVSSRLRVVEAPSEDELVTLYQGATAVASVATSDSMAVTLLEAMACGVPVVASDLRPIREGIGDLVPDALVPPRDATRAAAALRAVIDLAPTEREALGDRLRARVAERADHAANMTMMEQAYHRLALGEPAGEDAE